MDRTTMKNYDCDLQLHGKFASGVSKNLSIPLLAQQAQKKGLHVLVTGDIQHRDWLAHIKANLVETQNGVYMDAEQTTYFIIGTEAEDQNRLHHLIYLPDLPTAQTLREKLLPFGNLDCSMCGRPKLKLSPKQLAEITIDSGGIIGPSHAFTPYTGLFSKYDSLASAYGECTNKILFLELGLSADTNLADTMASNHSFAFLSSSDAHSAWPHRLGREFNRIQMKQPGFNELKNALAARNEKRIILNVGLDPREGKYHLTACNQCYLQFEIKTARERFHWKCPNCKGQIKRGVRDRINELSDSPKEKHPSFRPPYLHVLPLSEIIQQSLGVNNILAKRVQSKWADFVNRFGNEINVLLDAPESELAAFDAGIGQKIMAFRNGWVVYAPGGGGQYGTPYICESPKAVAQKQNELTVRQKNANRFSGQHTLAGF